MLHTFGDSHAVSGWSELQNSGLLSIEIRIHHLGAKLMHSVGMEGLSLLDIQQYGVRNGDIVVFCFGEIDCRCHVHKHSKNGHEQTINELVQKYVATIKLNISKYSDLKVCIYGVVPTFKYLGQGNNPEFPFLGTNEQRLGYTLYMNQSLKKACSENGFIFIDTQQYYAGKDGFLESKLSDGGLHIGDFQGLLKELRNKVSTSSYNNFESNFKRRLDNIPPFRWPAFSLIAQELLTKNRPLNIIETGCVREISEREWSGAGCSSILWNWMVVEMGGMFQSIDINPTNANVARLACNKIQMIVGDSITELIKLDVSKTDLIFLDSYDHNPPFGLSELHAVGELSVTYERLPSGCLIAVDDCSADGDAFHGKHAFIHRFFERMGIKPLLASYIYVWKKP